MEHERSETSNEQPVAARAHADFRDEPVNSRDDDHPRSEPDRHEDVHDRETSGDSIDSGPAPDSDSGRQDDIPNESSPGEGQGQSQPRGRGRGRGRSRRLSPRERRMQERNRRRESRPPYHGQHDASRSHDDQRERESRPESHLPPETRSLLEQARAELDQVREVLEGVLRDLDHVAEQLNKAEHEKDIAEAEIEQLRESLRRLHR